MAGEHIVEHIVSAHQIKQAIQTARVWPEKCVSPQIASSEGHDMEFEKEFERDFMQRTLALVKGYKGPYDATLLLNCLLGLLIVPKEASLDKIPTDPISDLKKWGISPGSINSRGKETVKNKYPDTLRGIVYNLRNSVAHFNFSPIHENRLVKGFKLSDRSGFDASIDVAEVRDFVEKLANHLEKQITE